MFSSGCYLNNRNNWLYNKQHPWTRQFASLFKSQYSYNMSFKKKFKISISFKLALIWMRLAPIHSWNSNNVYPKWMARAMDEDMTWLHNGFSFVSESPWSSRGQRRVNIYFPYKLLLPFGMDPPPPFPFTTLVRVNWTPFFSSTVQSFQKSERNRGLCIQTEVQSW